MGALHWVSWESMASDQAGPGAVRLHRIPVLWLQASHLESQGYAFIVKVIEAQLLFPKARSKAVLWKPALHPSPAQQADRPYRRRYRRPEDTLQ